MGMPAGRGMRGAVALGVAALALAAPASAPAQAVRPARLTVVTPDQAALIAGGALRVRVDAPARSVVRLSGLGRPSGAARDPRPAPFPSARTVRFGRAGTRVVSLPLSAAGRTALDTCVSTRVTVLARTRVTVPSARRRRAPAFTGAVRTRTSRATRTLASRAQGCYRVGIATRSINPGADGRFGGQPVYLGGYGIGSFPSGRAATGILGDGVQVRAIAISDGTRSFAMADIETQGWFTATKDGPLGLVNIRRTVAGRSGGRIKPEEVFVQSDHTHGGPDTIGVWGGVPAGYRRFIVSQTVDAVLEALDEQRPGRLHYGVADARDLLSNQFDYDAANRVMDSELRVLQARDGAETFATLLNFSAHTTVLGSGNTKVTGDWVSRANPMLERRFGGEALTVVATLGRTQPADRACADRALRGDAASLCTLDQYATRVVDRAAQAAAAAQRIPGDPVVAARSYLIQDAAINAVIMGLNYAGDPVGAPINRSLSPPWLTGNVVGTVTGTARIGDVLLSSMPGEAYPQIPLKVRELVRPRGHMTAGLSNDQLGYLIAPYEAYPEPVRRTFFNQRGDEVDPISNDNFAFNVSPTMGDRVTCSLLRGAGEVLGAGLRYREAYDRCGAFFNDLSLPAGADTR